MKLFFEAITDVGFAFFEGDMFFDKVPIDPIVANEFITNGIGNGKVGLWIEEHRFVGGLAGACGACGKVDDEGVGVFEAAVEHA